MRGLNAVLDAIRPGDDVYIAGSTGEPKPLLKAWSDDPDRTRNLRITTSAVPGINSFEISKWHPTAEITGLFMQASFSTLHAEGRYRWLPLSYGGFAKYMQERRDPIGTCVVQVSPRGPGGLHSLGLAAEFMPIILARAKRVLAIVNHAMPYMANAPRIGADRFDLSFEAEAPLARYVTGELDRVSIRIAERIAEFIRNGDAVQVGIGKVPAALLQSLGRHKQLRIQSGMLGDGFRSLSEAGALDTDWSHQGCVMVGSQELYDWAAEHGRFEIAGCEITHCPRRLAAMNDFVSVNSALEIDLLGQCNLETAGRRAMSGAGGAPDFARAAKLARRGISIIALPSTAKEGTISRILPTLARPCLVSVPRYDIDMVVTEHGVADLRGLSVVERGAQIASVADPHFHDALMRDWRVLCQGL